MLSLRPVQAMILTVLTVLLICTVGSYADHHDIETNFDWWPSIDDKQVFWKVTTGRHSWTSHSTYSWHRVFIQNHSDQNLTVEHKYIHNVTQVATNETKKDNSKGSFSVAASGEQPVSGSRTGWLGPDVSGWLEAGDYKLLSQTKVRFENEDEEGLEWRTATMITEFTILE